MDRRDRPARWTWCRVTRRIGHSAWIGEVPDAAAGRTGDRPVGAAARTLEKHDLARETLDRYRELNLLYRASETIGACLDAADVPRLVLAEAQHVDPVRCGRGLLPASPGAPTGMPAGRPGAMTRRGLLVRGRPGRGWHGPRVARTSPSGRIATGAGRPARAGVPISCGDVVLGIVVLGRLADARAFTAGDEKLLLGLASQAGIALERASAARAGDAAPAARRGARRRAPNPAHLAAVGAAGHSRLALRRQLPAPRVRSEATSTTSSTRRSLGSGSAWSIADVTGKGVPAALMMAYSRAVLRAESMAGRAALTCSPTPTERSWRNGGRGCS